jgi:hypothetical protein
MKLVLRNDKGKPVTPFQLAVSYVQAEGRDGEIYSLLASDTDCTFEKLDGRVFPTSGKIRGVPISPLRMEDIRATFIEAALSGAVAEEKPDGSVKLKAAMPKTWSAKTSADWLADYLRTFDYEVNRSGERLLEIKGESPRRALKGLCKGLGGARIRWVRKLKDD